MRHDMDNTATNHLAYEVTTDHSDSVLASVTSISKVNGVILPILPAEFWKKRSVLEHIQQAARSRRRSPDVVFHTVLARLAAYTSHNLTVQTGIGNPRGASLNYFVGIIARSGGGKSSAASIASSLIGKPQIVKMSVGGKPIYGELDCQEGPIGSGEGLCESYMGMVSVEVDTDKCNADGSVKTRIEKVKEQVRHNSYIQIDEGQILEQLANRKSATIGPIMRSAWTCDELGQQNATRETTRVIPSGSYSLGLVAGFQYETVMPIMSDTATGMAQRFMWCATYDKDVPKKKPVWPGELAIDLNILVCNSHTEMVLPDVIMDKLDLDAMNILNPDSVDSNEYDAHKPLSLIKIAGLLALMDGRRTINIEDWELSTMVWETSCGVRDAILGWTVRLENKRNDYKNAQYVSREMALHNAKVQSDVKVVAIATRIANKVHTSAQTDSDLNTLNKAKKLLRGGVNGERQYFDAAIKYAESMDWIIVEDSAISPGASQPGSGS